tara:strand:+ start:390 stop:887 length:498 start_codon:yes stop_codon:yes gene_type:complete
MDVTANGMIAKKNNTVEFVSDAAWGLFDETSKGAGNYVMGRKTFEVSMEDGSFPYPDRLNVVMTSQKIENKWGDSVIFTEKSPKGVLQLLEEKGLSTAFVGGGAELNSSFLKENLVDEIFLDVEPHLLGKGIPLFSEADFELELELLGTKMISKNEIQLHYKVKK